MKKQLYCIAIGSALGGLARMGLDQVALVLGLAALWATLLVNISGSVLIGWLAGCWSHGGEASPHPCKWHFWMTGFCGGYTTFSMFSWQVLEQLQNGEGLIAGYYAAGSVGISLFGTALGFSLGQRGGPKPEAEWNAPIRYYDREGKILHTESIYGEGFLRWAYGTVMGRLTVSLIVKRLLFSRWYGWRMSQPISRKRIAPFIEQYQLDSTEFVKSVNDFAHFNDFFWRRLKTSARPIARAQTGGNAQVIFPADGRHLVIPKVDTATLFYIKGQSFDLAAFIGDKSLAKDFEGGAMLISRLCPVDYHRFHFPVTGDAATAQLLPGSLSSVSPLALRRRLSILWENRRERTRIQTNCFGDVLLFEIGATCVGGIHQCYTPGVVKAGSEKGYFSFGGSCVVTLFQKGCITFDSDLLEQSVAGIESYGRMGERCAIKSHGI